MKEKIISTISTLKRKTATTSNETKIALTIFSIGFVLTSFLIASITNLSFPSLSSLNPLNILFPTRFQKLGQIEDYGDLIKILDSQPLVTKNKKSEFYLVFSCELFNKKCEEFRDVNFNHILNTYVNKNKVNLIWMDKASSDSSKNSLFYCTLEQYPNNFISTFRDISKEIKQVNLPEYSDKQKLNLELLQKCINDDKYKNRIEKLSSLSYSLNSNPVGLYLFQIENKNFKDSTGKEELKRRANFVLHMNGNSDFEKVIKPELDKYIK